MFKNFLRQSKFDKFMLK